MIVVSDDHRPFKPLTSFRFTERHPDDRVQIVGRRGGSRVRVSDLGQRSGSHKGDGTSEHRLSGIAQEAVRKEKVQKNQVFQSENSLQNFILDRVALMEEGEFLD